MTNDDPTIGELRRRFDRVDRTMDKGFAQIEERMSQLVTNEVFKMYQQGSDQRMAAFETAIANVQSQTKTNREYLQAEINQVENDRAQDRRTLTKAMIGAGATIAATIIGFILTVLFTGGPL